MWIKVTIIIIIDINQSIALRNIVISLRILEYFVDENYKL